MNTKFTKGPWTRCSRGENLIGANGKNVGVYNSGLSGVNKSVEAVANVHLIEASTDMYNKLAELLTFLEVMHEADASWTIKESIAFHKEVGQLLTKARGE